MAEAEKAAAYSSNTSTANSTTSPDPFAAYEEICERGMDVVQDLMDSFWANPLGWGYLLHFTDHRSEILDILGGRIYDEEPLDGPGGDAANHREVRSRTPVGVA